MKPHAKKLFWNAIFLSAASLLMRTVGVSFQVYVSNRAGAEAMGLFSLLTGVYGFALTLATSGLHLGVTRLVVDATGTGKERQVPALMRRALLYALLFGGAASLLLLTFAHPIGVYWLHDARTIRSLRLLALTLPALSLTSAMGGYFTAVRRPYKSATVQVIEQGAKILATMYLFTLFAPHDVETVCCILVLGGVAAELLSFVIELILYLWDRRHSFPNRTAENGRAVGRRLLSITLPIALTAYVRSGLITLQHVLIPHGLRKGGSSHAAALAAYGCIHAMALPVVLYPAALISSFSGLLVPELAEASVKEHRAHVQYMISRAWSLSLFFSIGVAGTLICLSQELGMLLYPGTAAGEYIRLLAPLIPIMYVDTTTDAMLKGLDEQVYSMKINVADAALSVLMVATLVPAFGISGYVVAIYVSELFNTVCSIAHLLNVSRAKVRLCKWVYKPLFCIVCATTLAHLIITRLGISVSAFSFILHCLLVIFPYFLLLRLTRAIDKDDLHWLCRIF